MSVYEIVEKLWKEQPDGYLKMITLQLAREIDLLWGRVNELKKEVDTDRQT